MQPAQIQRSKLIFIQVLKNCYTVTRPDCTCLTLTRPIWTTLGALRIQPVALLNFTARNCDNVTGEDKQLVAAKTKIGVKSKANLYSRKQVTKMSTLEESKETSDASEKRPQFGNRFLKNPEQVFQHNAWDNVTWDADQLTAAKRKVEENSKETVDSSKQESYETDADQFWDTFYSQHRNKFFKDRHWLFTEFPELSTNSDQEEPHHDRKPVETCGLESHPATASQTSDYTSTSNKCEEQNVCNSTDRHDRNKETLPQTETSCNSTLAEKNVHSKNLSQKNCETLLSKKDENSTCTKSEHVDSDASADFPGKNAAKRFLEVGCGVGNTVFPILQTNIDPALFVYCCDFSSIAVDIVCQHAEYNSKRCHAFVCDISNPDTAFPFPKESLDVIVMIFVLSAIQPNKYQSTISTLSGLLKPGGQIFFRDYGRYDMAQLRFKTGRCLSDNFYVRGDGTRVYFFTQEELRTLFTSAGLTEEQNLIDRRLQVNRGRQLTMYRVWIQCKYRKP